MTKPARAYHQAMLHYIRRTVSLADLVSGTAVVVGALPAGALVYDAFAQVTTAFDSGTSDVLDIGTADDPDGFATDLAISAVGRLAADELASSDDLVMAADTDIHMTWTGAGTAATEGTVTVVVLFAVDNDM